MRVFERDLPIAAAVGDQESGVDFLDHSIQFHPRRPGEQFLDRRLAEYPHHMIPVMRHRAIAFARHAALLHLALMISPITAQSLKRGSMPATRGAK